MTPHKSEACRNENEMLREYDMIGRRGHDVVMANMIGLAAWSWQKRKGTTSVMF